MPRTETRGRRPISQDKIKAIIKDSEAKFDDGTQVFSLTQIAKRNGVAVGTASKYVSLKELSQAGEGA